MQLQQCAASWLPGRPDRMQLLGCKVLSLPASGVPPLWGWNTNARAAKLEGEMVISGCRMQSLAMRTAATHELTHQYLRNVGG